MAVRDPEKTLRNKKIKELTKQIKQLLPEVLAVSGYKNELSLNATYGGKYAHYIDIKNEIIDTPEQFISLYFQGYLKRLEEYKFCAEKGNPYFDAYFNITEHKIVYDWILLFLRRTYLREYENLSKERPTIEESGVWIGQNNASYGLFVTPRFVNGAWQNDKSEIRRFKPKYWTIGHVLETGLLIPDKEKIIPFSDVDNYLDFFENVIVRNSGSLHERAIAERYCDFVKGNESPNDVPLLIPELRYNGKSKQHLYRLDFTIINPYNMSKIGFEVSPWSTHGHLAGIKKKTQKVVNEEAKQNFEKEMTKYKAYFRKFNIPILTYTDGDLEDYDKIFSEITTYLSPIKASKQLEFQAITDFFAFSA